VWLVLLPGLVAGYVPWRYLGVSQQRLQLTSPAQLLGLVCAGLGAALLGACVWQFAHSGRGTLSPLDPPTRLVVQGIYRHVRNPMYLGVTAILLGEALLIRSLSLVLYWVVWFGAANVFVHVHEEPTLRRQFGAAYEEYSRVVPRWIPRLRPTQAAHQ
jgi:protein-S-isoprenylcysteine O-methyltransferase Ste14